MASAPRGRKSRSPAWARRPRPRSSRVAGRVLYTGVARFRAPEDRWISGSLPSRRPSAPRCERGSPPTSRRTGPRVPWSATCRGPRLYDFRRHWQRKLYEAGLRRAHVAEGVRRPRPHVHGGADPPARRWRSPKAPPVLNVLGRGHGRPDDHRVRHRRAEEAATSRRSSPARRSGARATPSPTAGSDLASLQTRAVQGRRPLRRSTARRSGPSLAHIADWMMLLARTDPSAPKHKGITYFLARHEARPASP